MGQIGKRTANGEARVSPAGNLLMARSTLGQNVSTQEEGLTLKLAETTSTFLWSLIVGVRAPRFLKLCVRVRD